MYEKSEWEKHFMLWKSDSFFDDITRNKLIELENNGCYAEIEDSFYKELDFGTGGIRGLMGVGTNRINQYTVARVTTGVAKYLLDICSDAKDLERGVVIAYDSRHNSREFAEVVADVLSNYGIRVWINDSVCPTPQLSYSVRMRKALLGIVMTASHNPKEYNGYKIYDENGCQIVPRQAAAIRKYIVQVTEYRDLCLDGNSSLITAINDTDDFVNAILEATNEALPFKSSELKIMYTPLHGTGKISMFKVLQQSGFRNIATVAEQAEPNGDFPTVISPNPEEEKALSLAIEKAREAGSDIVLGTDPDSDRIGVAIRRDKEYVLLTGNQIGALLMDYIINNVDYSVYDKPAVVKTVVTSEMGAYIAEERGIPVFSTLTGFKYIGEKIAQFETAKANGDKERAFDFLFGYEESYGYLAGTHVLDKDAISSAVLICAAAAVLNVDGKTLIDRLDELYLKYGYFRDALDSFTLKEKEGLLRIEYIMQKLRSVKPEGMPIKEVIDYLEEVEAEPGFGLLPKENSVKYILTDGSWIAVRPSGTEPKIKIYYSIRGKNEKEANERFEKLRAYMIGFAELQ